MSSEQCPMSAPGRLCTPTPATPSRPLPSPPSPPQVSQPTRCPVLTYSAWSYPPTRLLCDAQY
eukprot:170610-Rhodomonas_salina.1